MESQEFFEPTKKTDKAKLFKEKYKYSLTMDKLMKKYGCKTVEEYRTVRKENRKATEAKAASQPKKSPTPAPSLQKKKK